jgi:hypothetical protein
MSPAAGYAGIGGARKILLSLLRGAAHDVADPKPRLEAAMLIEPMHAAVFSAALKQDVITAIGPGCCERRANNGSSMILTSKFGMSDYIFEKPVPPSGSQEIWCGDKHAGCNDLRFDRRYENRKAVVRQHV